MIKLPQARQLLKQAMETQGPNFQYVEGMKGCFYAPRSTDGTGEVLPWNDNRRKTGCLIGTALTLAGITSHLDYPDRIKEFARRYPDVMSPVAAEYFSSAQRQQDLGVTWGKAYEVAESYANSLQPGIE